MFKKLFDLNIYEQKSFCSTSRNMIKHDERKKTTCCLYITAKLLSGEDNPDVTDIAAL